MLLSWHIPVFSELRRALEGGAHAVLLSGPAGIGKRVLAEHAVGWRLCESPTPAGPCGSCAACHLLQAGNHPDRILIEPAMDAAREEGGETEQGEEGAEASSRPAKGKAKASRYITIDQVRELRKQLELVPHGPTGRVVLLDPADQMNLAAANGLLKTLEDPAPGTIFLLLTSTEKRLPATVRSRCRRLRLGLPPQQAALQWLRSEGIEAAEQALRLAGGAPLRAKDLTSTNITEQWNRLTQKLTSGSFRTIDWETTPEGLAHLCLLLQMLCVDLQRTRTGQAPAYASGDGRSLLAVASQLPAAAVSDFWRDLGRIKSLIQHPLNGALVRDQMLLGFERLMRSA